MSILDSLRYGLLLFLFLTIFLVVFAIASAPSREASRLGYRGLKRRNSVAEGGLWSHFEGLVRWLGVRVGRAIPADLHTSLDRQLTAAGEYLGMEPQDLVGLSVLSALGGAAFGGLFGVVSGMGALPVVLCTVVGAALPYLQVSSETQRRFRQIARGLPSVTDLLALAMGAGQDFPGAVRSVVEKWSDPTDAVVEEFTHILQELRVGRTRKEALSDFANRVPLDPVIQFTASIIQAEERGNPVAEVLQIQASMARMQRSVQAEEAASKAGVAMVAPLFLLFFCILLLVVAPMIMEIQNSGL